MIHGDPRVNVSVINGRPTRVFKFKLTTANLALRICKSEDLSGGLEILNQTDGLGKAQSVDTVDPLREGNTVKPNPTLLNSSAQSK